MRLILPSAAICLLSFTACNDAQTSEKTTGDIKTTRTMEKEEMEKRGQYIVMTAGCNDCHSPKIFNDHGFTLDSSRLMSGHPADSPLPPIKAKSLQPGNWVLMAPDVTAFVGPWGISRTANLTPDSTTGIGTWTEDQFIQTLRKGKHMGMDNGRPLMPPMPWELIGRMTDDDLRSIYAFLRTLPPIKNVVQAPTPPNLALAAK